MMQKRALTSAPASVRMRQQSAPSSNVAATTRVSKVTSRRRSKRSAT
jgi:hypothetical protein